MKILTIVLFTSTIGNYFIIKTVPTNSQSYEYIIPYACFDQESGKIICDDN